LFSPPHRKRFSIKFLFSIPALLAIYLPMTEVEQSGGWYTGVRSLGRAFFILKPHDVRAVPLVAYLAPRHTLCWTALCYSLSYDCMTVEVFSHSGDSVPRCDVV
jgi:hypothetical protein